MVEVWAAEGPVAVVHAEQRHRSARFPEGAGRGVRHISPVAGVPARAEDRARRSDQGEARERRLGRGPRRHDQAEQHQSGEPEGARHRGSLDKAVRFASKPLQSACWVRPRTGASPLFSSSRFSSSGAPLLILILGLVLFLGTHAFSMARAKRAEAIGQLGEKRFKLVYTLLSIAGLVLIAYGFHQYRASGYIAVWDPPVWTRHLAVLLNLFAFIALASTYLPGHIRARAKHPMLLAVKIWATAHLLANGDLGSILLFGSFLAWAVAARISAKRRALTAASGGVAARRRGRRVRRATATTSWPW